jgi:hypothetical protein
MGVREDRALAMLMGSCLLLFMSQWPYRARQAHETGGTLTDTIQHDAVGLIFVLPLLAYGLAALLRLVTRAFGAKADFYSARLALFLVSVGQQPCGGIGWDGQGLHRSGAGQYGRGRDVADDFPVDLNQLPY